MTNIIIQYNSDELRQLTNAQLLSTIVKIRDNHSLHWLARIIKRVYPNIYVEIKSRTRFLDKFYEGKYDSLPARLYCIEHDIMEQPICQNPNCPGHNPVKWYPSTNSFRKFCCNKCSALCESTQTLRKTKMIERHGVEYALQSQKFLDKAKNKWIENLGVDHPAKSKTVQQKMQSTTKERHGNSRYNNRELAKHTNFIRYGVEWYTQSEEYHKRVHKPYTNPKYPDMTFGSSWEFLVYDFLLENHIDFEYQPSVSLPYEYKETYHTYHPDFIVDGRVFEVKGDNFFRINESTGQEEMFCPYRDEDWSDEKYDWMCGLYEAKHQCMLVNDVVILRHSQVKNLTIEIFQ